MSLEYNSDTCEITYNGKVISHWNNEAHQECPEDLFSHTTHCFGIVSESGEVLETGFLSYSTAEDRLKELQ